MGNFKQALRTISRARRVLGDGGAGAQRAQLSSAYAAILQASGRSTEALRWCRVAIEEGLASGDDDALAHAYSILSWALAATGQPEHIDYAERALRIYERRRDLAGQALVLNYLGGYAYFEGRWDEAVELYERGRAARERTGDAVNAAYGVLNVGEILLDQGHVEEARQRFVSALRVWKAASHRWGVGAAELYLGRADARSGRCTEAFQRFDRAREIFIAYGDASVIEVDVRTAEARLLAGEPVAALSLVNALVERVGREGGIGVYLPTLHRIRGAALVARGELDAAVDAFGQSLLDARARNAPYDAALALDAIAHVASLRGRANPKATAEARSIFDRLGVIGEPGSQLCSAGDRPEAATVSAGAP
jgi:tetratricopeptide (TPR) repeat protein